MLLQDPQLGTGQPLPTPPVAHPTQAEVEPASKEDSPASPSAQLHHTSAQPLVAAADGLTFILSTGQVVLDAISGGAAVSCLGNGNAEVLETMLKQGKQMAYAYHQSLGHEIGEKLAEWLCERSDGALVAGAFLNSGSEAMEAAIKLVRQYWVECGRPEKQHIIARFPSYHGNTLGALGVGSIPSRRDIYKPLLCDKIHHVTSPQYKRLSKPGESEEEYSARLASELEDTILSIGPDKVMAFFAEPVVGAALGVMPPPKGYFPAIAAVCKRYDILLVMDEVMSGSGRVGEFFAHQAVAEGVKPDVLAMAKGLGGGYVTISAIMVGQKVANKVRQGGQWKNSHTYQNHPINCAVAQKVMEIIERDDLLSNVRARGEQLISEMTEATRDIPSVVDIRGKGLFVGVELDGSIGLKPRIAARVKEQAFKNGLLVMGLSGTIDGVQGETIVLGPAYTVTEEQISEIVRLLAKSIEEVIEAL
ncbi:class III aminotransferase [Kwoniella heveanensis BCC8398]|uniref:Class III aminotransferase n=1 Tax=Kwoniella heveanensis BCC8398 TaxID=1296120 RepID=A0A1B9GTK0_9TREE|nr:class III aminotransferase [Kwoniella heveanensis BCC8398]